MDNLLVILIIVLAGAYLVRTFYRRSRNKSAPDCACSSCDVDCTSNDSSRDAMKGP